MSGRLRFEVWTVPTAATFSRLADDLPVLPGGSGTVVMSDYADATIAIPLDATELPLVAAGALITVLDGTTIVDEFFAERVSKEIDRQGTPYASISGPGINGGLAKIAVYPFGLPNDIDWIWGSERNLLTNGGAEDNPLGIINPGFEDGTRAPWWPGAVDGVTATLTVDTTTPDSGTFSALVTALTQEGGMSTGVKVYPGKEYTLGVRARTPTGSGLWQLGASGPANIVPGAGATLVEHSPTGQFAPGHRFEAQRNTTFNTTYAAAGSLIFTAGPDQTYSQVSVREIGGPTPRALRVDNFTFTGFGVGVDPWEFTAGVTAFNASQAVAPFDGAWHFAITAPSGEGAFQGVGNFLPGETVTLNVAVRGAAATAVSIELRDVRGTVLGQTWGTMATGSWTILSLTATLPDFIPGPDGEIQVWVINRDAASATIYFEAEGAGLGLVHGFPAATATEILRLLMEAAYARGTALWLDISSFSDTLDSDGVALPLCPAFQTGPPQTLAHVARNLAELENGIEWTIVRKATPSGTFTHDLKVYIKGGLGTVITDGSKAVIGSHAGTSIGRLRAFTAAGALGDDGLWAEGTDAAGVTAVGRWEKPFDVPHLRSTDALTDFLDDAFADDEINRTAIQAQVRGDAQSVPLLDYRPGDTLPWIVPPYSTASRRVVTISWRHDDLAMYDVTGSKVFPGESATNKAIEILWDEVFHRRVSRPNTIINRPTPTTLPLPGGHPWWILATLGSSAEDRAIANVICDGIADNADIESGLLDHRNVWLCDSGDVPYEIDGLMDLDTDPGDLILAGEPGSRLHLNYNGPFFRYMGGGAASVGLFMWFYGITADSDNAAAGVFWSGGGLNAQPVVFFDHCSFMNFDINVAFVERLMSWHFHQCIFVACTPAVFVDVGGFNSGFSSFTYCIFDSTCSGNMFNNALVTILVMGNQLGSVAEQTTGLGLTYIHNLHGSTHSVGDHTGATGIDHGGLGGLGDDDHSQYFLVDGSRKATFISIDGITGAVSDSRYVGATASGAPSTGTFAIGDYIIDRTGTVWICTVAGSPGTWVNVGAAAGDADAIHDNVAGEIAAITEKTVLADGDWFILEDSAAANVKKRVKTSNLPGSASSLETLRREITAPYSVGDADDVMWQTDSGDFTTVNLGVGTEAITEVEGRLSVEYQNIGANDIHCFLKSFTFTIGDAFVTKMWNLSMQSNYHGGGFIISDGTTGAADLAALGGYHGDGTSKIATLAGTITNINIPGTSDVQTYPWMDALYLKLTYSAANTFVPEWSPDGISWIPMGQSSITATMTPTHFGLWWSNFGGAGASTPGVVSFGPIAKVA